MNQLTLEWLEVGQAKTITITDQQPSKNPGTVRLGRDPSRADVVLHHPTVSGLHVEIFFDTHRQGFFIRNLRDTNPPIVNRKKLTQGDALLQQGTSFYLGLVMILVVAIATTSPSTLIATPPAVPALAGLSPVSPIRPTVPSTPDHTYGLLCPKCRKTSPYERLRQGCIWCGTSLAAAESVLMMPEQ